MAVAGDGAGDRRGRWRHDVVALLVFAVLFVAVFAWAKWLPYSAKVPAVAGSADLGPSVLEGAESTSVSWEAGWEFMSTYVADVWPAIVAGLVVAAGLQTLVPRGGLQRVFGSAQGSPAATGRAVLAGLPMMLCTCCSAPVAVALRRSDVAARAALAYWLATPLLNPVVLVFALVVLSPQWMLLRLAGGLLVLGLAVWLATPTGRGAAPPCPPPAGTEPDVAPAVERRWRAFAATLLRLTARLLPEYLVLLFALGALRGLLFPLGHDLAAWGVAAALLLAVAGMLLPVPTGAEVAVVAALLAAGAPAWLAAALLVTLPAVSLPSLSMVRTSFSTRALLTVPAVVVLGGLASSGSALALF